MIQTTSGLELNEEWAAFLAEPWGDEWRPVAVGVAALMTYASGGKRRYTHDQVLEGMLATYLNGIRNRDSMTDEEMMRVAERFARQANRKMTNATR